MANVTIKYQPIMSDWVQGNLPLLIERLTSLSAELLGRRSTDIILEFSPFGLSNSSTPDILIRCETSPRYKDRLEHWTQNLVEAIQSLNPPSKEPPLRIAAKGFALESVWYEHN